MEKIEIIIYDEQNRCSQKDTVSTAGRYFVANSLRVIRTIELIKIRERLKSENDEVTVRPTRRSASAFCQDCTVDVDLHSSVAILSCEQVGKLTTHWRMATQNADAYRGEKYQFNVRASISAVLKISSTLMHITCKQINRTRFVTNNDKTFS